mmetsp:Transcript_6024/g.11433  ORF Transcript_6024/g.11433 Transcript_6024/m.11433 type:complete len:292 (+) Transcript_6024:261-1136(+)
MAQHLGRHWGWFRRMTSHWFYRHGHCGRVTANQVTRGARTTTSARGLDLLASRVGVHVMCLTGRHSGKTTTSRVAGQFRAQCSAQVAHLLSCCTERALGGSVQHCAHRQRNSSAVARHVWMRCAHALTQTVGLTGSTAAEGSQRHHTRVACRSVWAVHSHITGLQALQERTLTAQGLGAVRWARLTRAGRGTSAHHWSRVRLQQRLETMLLTCTQVVGTTWQLVGRCGRRGHWWTDLSWSWHPAQRSGARQRSKRARVGVVLRLKVWAGTCRPRQARLTGKIHHHHVENGI